MLKYNLITTVSLLLCLGCSIDSSPRDATKLAYPALSAPISSVIAAGLLPDAPDKSAVICEETDCPTVGEALRAFFDSEQDESLTKLSSQMDERMNEYEARAVDHYVPCLEEAPTEETTVFYTDESFVSYLNCYGFFPQRDVEPSSDGYAQFVFGSNADSGSEYMVERRGEIDTFVATIWTVHEANGDVELRYATNRSLTNAGGTYSHLKAFAEEKVIELTTAGANQFTTYNPLSCGIQMRANGDFVYVKGKFIGPSVQVNPLGGLACGGEEVVYCMNAADLSAAAVTECEAANLVVFSRVPMDPALISSDTWGSAVFIDHSQTVSRFAMEGLEVY